MIRGRTVNLRVVQERDLEPLFALQSELASRGEFFPINLPSHAGFLKEFRESGFWDEAGRRFLIVDPQDRMLGSIFWFRTARYLDAYEIGYILYDAASRGKGAMSEALALTVDYVFAAEKVHRLQLSVVVGNEASRRVAIKCGFQIEGIARQAFFLRGRHGDLEVFSLLRPEHEKREPAR